MAAPVRCEARLPEDKRAKCSAEGPHDIHEYYARHRDGLRVWKDGDSESSG